MLTRQLATQTFRNFEQQIISGLPNQAAHNQLYRTIAERAGSFDLFLKLDADMTFRSDTALEDAVRAVASHPEIQHFAFKVWDCFTETETLGVHLFRSGVTWGRITDDLFVDPDPPGATRLVWEGPPAPFVNHGEYVSDFECFSFGVHKFLKAAQRGRHASETGAHRLHKYYRHMHNCARIRDLYRTTGARRHRLALMGMMWAMQHDTLASYGDKTELQRLFDAHIRGGDEMWSRRVERLSRSLVAWRFALLRSLGVRRAFA